MKERFGSNFEENVRAFSARKRRNYIGSFLYSSLLNFARFNKEQPCKFGISKSLSIPGYEAQGT